jgi:AhpD family alkylhydroperoxidase
VSGGAPTSRLPPVADPESNPLIKELFDQTRAARGRVLNLHLTNAHAPNLSYAQRRVVTAIRTETVVPQSLIELAILCAAQICGCEYEAVQHVPLALNAGLTRAQIDAVKHWRTSDAFDARARALLAWIEAICSNKGEVEDAIFTELSRHFSPQEIYEVTFSACHYYGTGLMMKAFRIQLEPDSREAAERQV